MRRATLAGAGVGDDTASQLAAGVDHWPGRLASVWGCFGRNRSGSGNNAEGATLCGRGPTEAERPSRARAAKIFPIIIV